jgi:hypothetical protein
MPLQSIETGVHRWTSIFFSKLVRVGTQEPAQVQDSNSRGSVLSTWESCEQARAG